MSSKYFDSITTENDRIASITQPKKSLIPCNNLYAEVVLYLNIAIAQSSGCFQSLC